MKNYKVVIDVNEIHYNNLRDFLHDAKFPIAGHTSNISMLNRWLYMQALRQFNNLQAADKLSILSRVTEGEYI